MYRLRKNVRYDRPPRTVAEYEKNGYAYLWVTPEEADKYWAWAKNANRTNYWRMPAKNAADYNVGEMTFGEDGMLWQVYMMKMSLYRPGENYHAWRRVDHFSEKEVTQKRDQYRSQAE